MSLAEWCLFFVYYGAETSIRFTFFRGLLYQMWLKLMCGCCDKREFHSQHHSRGLGWSAQFCDYEELLPKHREQRSETQIFDVPLICTAELLL